MPMLADERRREHAVLLALALLGVLLLAFAPPFAFYLGSSALITALLTLSTGLAFRAGLPSLAQVALMATGSWSTLWLTQHGVSLWVAVPLATLAAGVIGLLLILAAARLRGLFLLIATLAFAVAALNVIGVLGFPGAAQGLFLARPGLIADDRAFFGACLLVTLVVAAIVVQVGRTRLGVAWVAVGASERSVAAAGINVLLARVTCFVVCSLIAGLAGTLLVAQQGVVDVNSFSIITALVSFSVAIMVGAHRPDGAVLAGILSVGFPEVFARIGLPQDLGTILFAVGAIHAMSAGGGGSAELWRRSISGRAGTQRRLPAEPKVPADGPPVSLTATRTEARIPLSISNIRVAYGSCVALDGVEFEVAPGTVLGVVGANGAGKSTLVDAVSGFAAVQIGSVALGPQRFDRAAPARRVAQGVRRTFQHQREDDRLSVGAYRQLHGQRIPDDHPWLSSWPAESAPLAVLHEAQVRLLHAETALLSADRFALLDEPASGLDTQSRAHLAARIREAANRGLGVLVVEHDVAFLTEVCDEAIALDQGRIIARGPMSEVLADPRVVAAYLGAPA